MVYYPIHPLVLIHSKLQLPSMIASQDLWYRASHDFKDLFLLFVCWKEKNNSRFPYCAYVIVPMPPMVIIEPNGSQDILTHDDVVRDIVVHGWDIIIRRFEGYNLAIERDFA
jgi:hypothetical protein